MFFFKALKPETKNKVIRLLCVSIFRFPFKVMDYKKVIFYSFIRYLPQNDYSVVSGTLPVRNMAKRRCREERDRIQIKNIISDDRKSKKNLTVKYHTKLGGGVKTSLFSMQEELGFGRQRRYQRLG